MHRGNAFLEGGLIVREPPYPTLFYRAFRFRPASHGMSRLPRHNSSPVVQLVSRFGSSPLPTSRGITRHHVMSRNIMRHTVTSCNPRGTSHLPLAFHSQPGCPASHDIPRLPLLLLLSHPWDIPRLPGIP